MLRVVPTIEVGAGFIVINGEDFIDVEDVIVIVEPKPIDAEAPIGMDNELSIAKDVVPIIAIGASSQCF